MKKTLILVSLLAVLSCHKDQLAPNTCQVKDPLNELGWLRDTITSYTRYGGDVTVYQTTYKQQTVFSIDSFLGPDAGSGALYYCDGSVICKSYMTIAGVSGNCGDIPNELLSQTLIYQKKR